MKSLDPEDWSSYRLSLADMKLTRAHSTHWRATCDFQTIGIDFRDYFRALLDDYDVMAAPALPVSCKRYEFINIRGNQCINCTAFTMTITSATPCVVSYQTSLPCDLDGKPNGGKFAEMNFGFYTIVNPAFRCSATKDSTTQYWFGKMWTPCNVKNNAGLTRNQQGHKFQIFVKTVDF